MLENTGGGIDGTVTGIGNLQLQGIMSAPRASRGREQGVNCAALAATDAAGRLLHHAASLPGGYRILFYAGDYNQSNAARITPISGPAPRPLSQGTVTTVNAQLDAGGVISGRVIDEDDLPLPGVGVQFFNADGLWVGEAGTDGNGEYTQNLTPGTYTVSVQPGGLQLGS